MENYSLTMLLWLLLLSLVAGIIDAMAGGGGLLTVPGLMATGINPIAVLATNKLQAIFSPLSATIFFWHKGKINLREHLLPALMALLGGFVGAWSLSYADPNRLKVIVPFLLVGIAIWFLIRPNIGSVTRKARFSFVTVSLTLIPLIGFYDGFFGPGTGAFLALGLVSFSGLNLEDATLRAKVYNLSSNLGALSFFLFSGKIVWIYGAVMVAGMLTGGHIGARLVLKHGTRLIRPVLVAMSLAISAKLLWQQGILKTISFDDLMRVFSSLI